MNKFYLLYLFCCVVIFTSCAGSKAYKPYRKFDKVALREDLSVLRNVLEHKHPALYWYTSKDSMDYCFDSLYRSITDSMNEVQFGWKILAPLTQKIHCGHTSFGMSRRWSKFTRDRRTPSFPLFLKIWGDTMIVTGNYNKNDSFIKRGTQITSINGLTARQLTTTMFQYLPQDGYADNVNYIRLSANFPYYHRNIFGLSRSYDVGYIDSATSKEMFTTESVHIPLVDTGVDKPTIERFTRKQRRQYREEMLADSRSFEIDSSKQFATFTLNTFSKGNGRRLKLFMKRSFRKLRKQHINDLVLDVRNNGGGDVGMYVLLTKYIRNTPFKVADTAYAVSKNFKPYAAYVKNGWLYNLSMIFMTKKKSDGNYHFGFWERHFFKPKKKNHYNGNVYVLISGPTFSASTLFCNAVKGQSNVKLVGEETGGGWYGNSGIIIPDITLPNTKMRVRLPFFKLVQYNHVAVKGTGIPPDIYIPPTAEGVRKSIDRKLELTKAMIRASHQQ